MTTTGTGERITFVVPLDGAGGTLSAELKLPRTLTPRQAARIKAFIDIVVEDGNEADDADGQARP